MKPLDGLRGQPQPWTEHLERDPAAERGLHGLVDDAHAATAHLPYDVELAQSLADQIPHPGRSRVSDARL